MMARPPSTSWALGLDRWPGQRDGQKRAARRKTGLDLLSGSQGRKGKANNLFASLNGWLVAKQAPKETVDFMKVWLGKDTQIKLAEQGLFIPAVKGTAASFCHFLVTRP